MAGHTSNALGSADSQSSWDQHLASVKLCLRDKDYKSALASLNKAILAVPQKQLAECYGLRGYIRLHLKEFQKAEEDCTAALDLNSQGDEYYIWRGSARASLERWIESIADLRTAIETNPANQASCQELIRYSAESAIEKIRKLAVAGKLRPQHWFERAVAYHALQMNDKALRDVNLALRAEPDDTAYSMLRGELHLEMDEWDKAIADLSQVVDSDRGRRTRALRLRAVALAKAGNSAEAFHDLNRVTALLPKDTATLMQCGDLRLENGDWRGAVKDYSSALKANGRNEKAYFARGQAYAQSRNFLAAQQDFDKAIKFAANPVCALIERGNCSLQLRMYDQAIADFQQVIQLDETLCEAHLGLARTYFAKRDWQEAGRMCNAVLRLDPRNAKAFVIKGGVHFEKRELDSAILSFSRALESTHDEETLREAYYRRGIARLEGKVFDEAINDLNQVLLRNPRHAGAMFWRANGRAKQGQWLASLEDLQATIDVNPDHAGEYRKFANLVAQKAIAHLNSLGQEERAKPENCQLRALALLLSGEYQPAVEDFDLCLQVDPAHLLMRIRRGQANMLLEKYTEAVADFQEAVRIEGNNALAHECLAESLLCNGNRKEAVLEFSQAIRLRSDDERLFLRRGRLHTMRGKPDKALEDFTHAIEIRPESYEAYRERGLLHALIGKNKRAIQDMTVSIELFPKQPDLIARRGELHLKRLSWEAGKEDFELALALDPKLVRACCGRALAMVRRDEHEQALIWLTKSIHRFEATDDLVEILSTRARVFYGMARFNRAIADYTTVIQMLQRNNAEDRRFAPSYYARGIAHFHENDFKAAQEDWQQAMSLSPAQKLGEKLLAWLYDRKTTRPAALEPVSRIIRPTRPALVGNAVKLAPDEGRWNSEPPYDLWLVQSDEPNSDGIVEFGPVPKEILNEWCQEGRIAANTKLLRADWSRWKRATAVFPELAKLAGGNIPAGRQSVHDSMIQEQSTAEDL